MGRRRSLVQVQSPRPPVSTAMIAESTIIRERRDLGRAFSFLECIATPSRSKAASQHSKDCKQNMEYNLHEARQIILFHGATLWVG